MSNLKIKLIYFILFFVVQACEVKTFTENPVVFRDQLRLENEIKLISPYKRIEFNGKTITEKKRISRELNIEIMKGDDITMDRPEIKRLQKQIALIIKQNLIDTMGFDIYNISFFSKITEGAVTTTKRIANTYTAVELEN